MANLRANNLTGTGGRNAIKGSIFFNGNYDTLGVPVTTNEAFGSGNWTIEFWFKMTQAASGNKHIYDGRGGGSNSGVYTSMWIDNNEKVVFYTGGNSVITGGTTVVTGSWNHVALVKNSSTTTLYLNGVSDGTYSDSNTYLHPPNNTGVIGGDDNGTSLYYYGYLSNFRMVKGTAVYTAAFTPPTSELSIVDGTTLLCCQDSMNPEQEATGKTITGYGDLSVSDGVDLVTGTWTDVSSGSASASGSGKYVTAAGSDLSNRGAAYMPCTVVKRKKYEFGFRCSAGITNCKIGVDSNDGTDDQRDAVGNNPDLSYPVSADSTTIAGRKYRDTFINASTTTADIYFQGINGTVTADEIFLRLVDNSDIWRSNNEFPSVGVDEGVTFGGDTKHNTLGHMYFPTGDTSQRGRGRGVFGGGYTAPANTNVIEYFEIQSGGKAQDFGDLNNAKQGVSALSSSVRGLFAGGGPSSEINTIDYVTLATTSNATDFGDLTAARKFAAPASNSTRGVYAGGETPTIVNTIDYVTIATVGNAADFGDLATVSSNFGGCSSATRGVFGGGDPGINVIEYVTIATTGNATDFGDLTAARRGLDACSSSTRGLFAGGLPGAQNTIDYITIASAGNAADFGDLRNVMWLMSATSSHTRGVWAGGYNPSSNVTFDTMDSTEIATLGNAVQFGTLISKRRSTNGGTSDCHGGLS